jgi:hypothetical protein
MRPIIFLAVVAALFAGVATTSAQLGNSSFLRLDDPAIGYTTRQSVDIVADLNKRIQEGKLQLKFDGDKGYLRAVLDALNIPVESQVVAFSKTAAQVGLIHPQSPHTIFFNDTMAVGFVRGGFIELAAQDPQQGAIFYDLAQEKTDKPSMVRQDWCLGCHYTNVTMGIPGFLTRSMPTQADGNTLAYLDSRIANSTIDHRSPFAERWGGWYVTGEADAFTHMGNLFVTSDSKSIVTDKPLALDTLVGKFDTNAYLSPYSDIAALLVFNHQIQMMNLLTRIGWETRVAVADKREDQGSLIAAAANEVVDYMLFVDEAPLPGKVKGTSGFAEKFAAEGPVDAKGRSLRQLDLDGRLMRYPCSYMIYTAAFDGLPTEAREAIYRRMWQVLSGQEKGQKYARLSLSDRQSVVEILRDTKKGLPAYFQPVSQ